MKPQFQPMAQPFSDSQAFRWNNSEVNNCFIVKNFDSFDKQLLKFLNQIIYWMCEQMFS